MKVEPNCIIVENTVTGICNVKQDGMLGCLNGNVVEAIPSKRTTISGTLTV
ncbi:hypothetical protein KIN20_011466 [Parelaphostrongylus tenuis]|uniref:Uncharacterized protein n=1 Tax=Parelaphostrongylus tenuis TaxID=148309 RepID=A0AAD5MV14_PARTN|nr:hypothetical protein KIN20_011466 [Parelaphostrongylus tenuis]